MTLSAYEETQVAEIAAWKALRPSLLEATLGRLAATVYDRLGQIVPETHVGPTLIKAFDLAEKIESTREIALLAGVDSIETLKNWELQACDALVARIALKEESVGLTEAVMSEVGGLATEIINMPIQAREVILLLKRVGHCYGYTIDDDRADAYLKTMIILTHETAIETRQELLDRLRKLETESITEAEIAQENQEIESEIGAGFAEGSVMEFVPYLGILVSVYNDFEYFHHLTITAQRVFQERFLRDQGKVETIAPALESRRESTLANMFGFARELVYTSGFGVGYGAGFIGYGLGWLVRENMPRIADAATEGATQASQDARSAADHVAATTKGLLGIGMK